MSRKVQHNILEVIHVSIAQAGFSGAGMCRHRSLLFKYLMGKLEAPCHVGVFWFFVCRCLLILIAPRSS